MTKAFISGCKALELSAEEKNFFRDEDPWGLILFRRNCESPEQLTKLTCDFRAAVGRPEAPVLIDQEGGRVQRLRPPVWRKFPPAKLFGDLYLDDEERAKTACRLGAKLIANELRSVGITVDCLPVLDVLFPETVDAIGDRAYSSDPAIISELGKAAYLGLLDGGVMPVIKHLPGHGRAQVDSHLELPVVKAGLSALLETDVAPFKAFADAPLGMTAHLLYREIDPASPATQSAAVINTLIREKIGFEGCLMSDDISMKALGGSLGDRVARTHAAGCDLVLHCNGELDQMMEVARNSPEISGLTAKRCAAAMSALPAALTGFDADSAYADFRDLTGMEAGT